MIDHSSSKAAREDSSANAPGAVSGLFESLRNLFASLITMAQTRLELLTTELQEEVQRAAALLVWALIALVTSFIGLLLAAFTIIFAFWDSHRLLAALAVTAVFIILAGVAIAILAKKVRSQPRFLDGTLTELAKDSAQLRARL